MTRFPYGVVTAGAAAVAAVVGAAASVLVATALVQPVRAAHGDGAGAFLTRVVEMKARGDWAESWDLLYPAHKAVVPRWLYSKCEGREPLPGELTDLDVLKIADERFVPPGLDAALPTKAVTLRFTVVDPALKGPYSFTHTFHVAAVRGGWRWFLAEDRYAAFSHGGCPI